jgi:hypothetical protein
LPSKSCSCRDTAIPETAQLRPNVGQRPTVDFVIYKAQNGTLAIEQEDGLTLQQVYERPGEVFAVEVSRESGFPKAEEGGVTILLPCWPARWVSIRS